MTKVRKNDEKNGYDAMNEMTLTYETHIFDTKQDYNVDMQSNYFPSFTLEKHKFFRLHFISWCKIQKSKAFKSQSFDNFTFICVHKPIFSFNFFFFSLCFFFQCVLFFCFKSIAIFYLLSKQKLGWLDVYTIHVYSSMWLSFRSFSQ